MPIIFGLSALLGWGIGEFFGAIASKKLGGIKVFFWVFLISLFLASFYIPFAPKLTNIQMLSLAFILQFIHILGNISYLRGLEIGNTSIVNPIASSYGIVVVLLSFIFYRDPVSTMQIIGIILALTGVFLILFPLNLLRSKNYANLMKDKGIVYAIFTSITWGVAFAFIKTPSIHIGWFWSYFTLLILSPLSFFYAKSKKINLKINSGMVLLLAIPAILITLGNFAYNFGVSNGSVAIIAPIASSSPVVFVTLSRLFLKEKLTKQQGIGIIVTLAGIVILGLA